MATKSPINNKFNIIIIFHNLVILCLWIYVELLFTQNIYRHLRETKQYTLNGISCDTIWAHVGKHFKAITVLHTLGLLYDLFGLYPSRGAFYRRLIHILKNYILFFVSIPLLKGKLDPRWFVTNIGVTSLLSIINSINIINNERNCRNEFLEWAYDKLFLIFYPLLVTSDIFLIYESASIVKEFNEIRTFPTKMPNLYNFEIDLYVIYKCLPFLLVLTSLFTYFKKLKFF